MDWKKELQLFTKSSLQKVDTHIRHATSYVIDTDPDCDVHFVTTTIHNDVVSSKNHDKYNANQPKIQQGIQNHNHNIFIGSFEAATNISKLIVAGITRVLNVSSINHSIEMIQLYHEHNIEYQFIPLDDIPDEPNLDSVIHKAIQWLEQETNNDNDNNNNDDDDDYNIDDTKANSNPTIESKNQTGILIHCNAGISRSTTIICAWLIRRYNYTYDSALKLVKTNRPSARPNDGFQVYLKNLQ